MKRFRSIRFLKNVGFSGKGFETKIVEEDDSNIYYYDEEHRYCYLPKESEGIDYEYIKNGS